MKKELDWISTSSMPSQLLQLEGSQVTGDNVTILLQTHVVGSQVVCVLCNETPFCCKLVSGGFFSIATASNWAVLAVSALSLIE